MFKIKNLFCLLLCITLCFGMTITSYAGGLPQGVTDDTPPQPINIPQNNDVAPMMYDAPTIGSIYTIHLGTSNAMLNVNSGIDANGTRINIWVNDGSIEQKFKVISGSSGTYRLQAMCSSSGRVLDAYRPITSGCTVDIWDSGDAPAQDLYITHASNGLYTIRLASYPTLYLTATGTSNGSAVQFQTAATNYTNQKWCLDKVETISYGNMGWQYPLPGHYNITCGFLGYDGHKGMDIGDSTISNNYLTTNYYVKSAAAGTVIRSFVDISTSYGNGYAVAIETNNIDPYTGNKLIYTYAHFRDAPTLRAGDSVSKNVTVGIVGSTGNSSGPHLHMQVNKAGAFWTSNNSDFVNPILFYPNISFTGDTIIRTASANNVLNTQGLSAHEYINEYIIDMSLIDHVGIDNFESWWQQKSIDSDFPSASLSSFLKDFNIDISTFEELAVKNNLDSLYDIEYITTVSLYSENATK